MLNKKYRLTKNGSYNFVYKKGQAYRDCRLQMFFVIGKATRVGFSVSNKVGNAVVRNLVKRRLRASVGAVVDKFAKNAQVVFVAKPQIANCSYQDIQALTMTMLKKAGLIVSSTAV